MSEKLVYGAWMKVYIKYEKGFEEICQVLSEGLEAPSMRIGYMEYEPYEQIAYLEVLGFETQLTCVRKEEGKYDYLFEADTMDCFIEIYEKRMYDLSLWMARHISIVCDLETSAEN